MNLVNNPAEVEQDLKIDYSAFRSAYWPHFPQHLTKGLGASMSANIRFRILISNLTRSCSSME